MSTIDTELETRIGAIFSRRPELWGFAVQDRQALAGVAKDAGPREDDLFVTEIGIFPRLGTGQYGEIYMDIATALSELVEERPVRGACLLALGAARAQEVGKPLLLVASPEMKAFYAHTVLVAVPAGESGHLGFILNRPTGGTPPG